MGILSVLLEHPGPLLACTAGAFFAGSIPFGLLLALAFGKTDVRKAGSGNIGATNVARVAGRKLGIVTLVLDALKGGLPVVAALHVFDGLVKDPRAVVCAGALTGFAAVVGHCFTPWLRFKGGKGVATGLGVLLALHPEIAGYAVLAFAVAFAASRLVSVSSLAAAIVVVIALIVQGPVDVAVAPVVACLAVIGVRHVENIRRVWKKQELKV